MVGKTWRKSVLGMLLAAIILFAPKMPAWGVPGIPQFQTVAGYQGPAQAEVQELTKFVTPIMNDYAIAALDFASILADQNPDMFIQQYEPLLPTLDADPTTSPALKNKIRAALNKAKTNKQLGKTVDDKVIMQRLKTAMPQFIAQTKLYNEKLYTGMRPRLFKIADKDPDYALKMCDMMQHNQMLMNRSGNISGNSAGLGDTERRLINLPNEIRQYANQVKARQGH